MWAARHPRRLPIVMSGRNSPNSVLGTITRKLFYFADEMKQRQDVHRITARADNRITLVSEITGMLTPLRAVS